MSRRVQLPELEGLSKKERRRYLNTLAKRRWREDNREREREIWRAFYERNKERRRAEGRKRYESRSEEEEIRQKAVGRAWRLLNIEKRREYMRQYKLLNKEHLKKLQKKNELKRRYGISLEDFEQMINGQNNECAICGRRVPRLVVDHDHKTGRVRKLLCVTCNTSLGWYEKYTISISKYLTE